MPNIAVEHFGSFPLYRFINDEHNGVRAFIEFLQKRNKFPNLLLADLYPVSDEGLWELRLPDGETKRLRVVTHWFPLAFFETASDDQEVISGRNSEIYLMYKLMAVAQS